MRTILLTLAGMLCAVPAGAADTTFLARVFSQVVLLPIPSDFVPAFEDAKADFYIAEAVPRGETVEAWSRMITVTGHRRAARQTRDPVVMANNMAAGMAQACTSGFVAEAVGAVGDDGFIARMGCGRVTAGGPERSETLILFVKIGRDDIYTLQWAERGPAVDGAPAFRNLDAVARRLASAELCDPQPGEQHPYPSCMAR
jgi:hypothetical protein